MSLAGDLVSLAEKLPEPITTALVDALRTLVEGGDPRPALERVIEEQARQKAFDELMTKAKG